jgi:hypothetical protein
MNTAIMIGKENGNGINSEIARLIPSDIAIHNSCCERKSLLLLNQLITHIFIITILNTILFDDLDRATRSIKFIGININITTIFDLS